MAIYQPPAHTPSDALIALRNGGVIIVPTETVYGLAADASNAIAIKRLYALKERPHNQPFSLLVADLCMARRYGKFDERAQNLAEAFWPGPLTLIVPLKADAPLCPLVLAGGKTVGLRVPDHESTRALISQFGGALAAPSANRAGAPAPTKAKDIAPDIRAGAAICLDDGPCQRGIASTLVDVSNDDIKILRQGDLARDAIMKTWPRP
ncbi:MAG: L-threonylcarbamoyladenylate synthase [Robiginitomaculum sp.]|nr:L-threonylcarbamoyladenylate synthase [Robiginitomaculum sp.]MDQ7078978.1 L-threonylcarbamoyladenylate synthase [Robiginitomaculum sp.]